jgi:hypothetical protein
MNLHFRVGHTAEAESLIVTNHYTKRMAGAVRYVCTWHESGGLFGDYGVAVAACTFSIPPTRWDEPVLELSRLVKVPRCRAPLTKFLACAMGFLKKEGEPLVVSFADMTQGHHGGIYQAASWHYGVYREPRQDGLFVDDVFIPGRSCNSRWGTRSPSKLADLLGSDRTVEPHMDAGKHLYWKPVTAEGNRRAKRLGLERLPYPKPDALRKAS